MDVHDLYRPVDDDAVVLNVHVQPGAGRTAVVGRHGTALKVRVAAPPEGGRANEACAALLSDTFAAGGVELVSGASSRSKRYRLSGLDMEEFARTLERAVTDGGDGHGPDPRRPGRR
jgi:uncharacterized protein (TIGR00251 family)